MLYLKALLVGGFKVFGMSVLAWGKAPMVAHSGVLLVKESKEFKTLAPAWTEVLYTKTPLAGRLEVLGRMVLISNEWRCCASLC